MPLSDDLRRKYATLWERMVTHPFVQELGENTLPLEKFQRYLLQDYHFLRDLTRAIALGVAKAPDFDAARRLTGFLDEVLKGEEALFRKTFAEWGFKPEAYQGVEPTPSALGYSNLLLRTAYEGGFWELLALLVVSEWTYLDWAQRLAKARKAPGTPIYQAWIAIHCSSQFEEFVSWLRGRLDSIPPGEHRLQVERLFRHALLYELMFWEMAYKGEGWPA